MTATTPPQRSGEAGFTLVELLVAMTVGVIVILGSFGLLDVAFSQQAKISDRQDAVERGRRAMAAITQQLRSTVCLTSVDPARAIVDARDDQVTFFADLSGGVNPPQKRTLAFDPAAGTITETDYDGVAGSNPPTFSATPSRTRVLLTGATRVGSTPFFRYYAFASPGVLSTTPLTTPLSATDATTVVDVAIAFTTRPEHATGATPRDTVLQSDVYTRFVNPTYPNFPLQCA